ncbi:MAG TPA: GNAT family N-acetyltransferase [Frankiaceae bacterium]|nr:GNAT family N-acetyltransferase [Frankiaceae bacterium]
MTFIGDPSGVTVEQVRPEITYALRREVLRPGKSWDELALPGDREHSTGHFAAYLEHEVVGVATVFEEPEADGPGVWRLRGMAVDPAVRGQGVGSAIVERVRDFVTRSGGGLLWCNARVSAEGFYRSLGFVAVSEPWDDPEIGPHVRMHDAARPESPVGVIVVSYPEP